MHPMRNQFGKSLCWALGLAAAVAHAQAQSTQTITTSVAALTFQYQVGAATLPAAQTVQIVSSPAGAAFTVTGAPWLKISPTGNISVAGLFSSVSATVDPTGLLPKTYTATVTIAAPAAANKSQTVGVTLTVSGVAPMALGVWPTGLIQGSPQSIVTLLGTSFYATSTVTATGFTPLTTITVTDSTGTSGAETLGIPVYTAAATLPSRQMGSAYNQTLTVSGGTPPYTWSATGLPPGITLSAAGVLSGTPSSVGQTGPLTSTAVSDTATLVTVPATYLASPGTL